MNKRTEEMSDIESLIKYKDIDGSRWYPISIELYRYDVSQGILKNLEFQYRSNIAYSLQYLEYLELQLKELKLSSVITSMIFKNFIIVAASIVEIVFYHLAKSKGKIKLRYERQIFRQDVKDIKNIQIPKSVKRLTLFGYEPLNEGVEDFTRFETLISIVRDNQLLMDTDLSKNKDYLGILRKLRNKIHLTTAKDYADTDYNSFYYSDYLKAKTFLFLILTDSNFGKNDQRIFPKIINAIKNQVDQYKKRKDCLYQWID